MAFYVGLPHISESFKINFLSFLIATIIVLSVHTKFNIVTVLVIITLTVLISLIIHSSRGSNREGSLPSATYPIPPHLGLDGISLVNRSF